MAELQKNPKAEKDRSMKILNWMQRAEEVQHRSKADAHVKGAAQDKQQKDAFKKQNAAKGGKKGKK